jgi:hypothetical protein
VFSVLANFSQNIVRLLDLAKPKSGETDLHQRTVKQNLVFDWLLLDD